MKYTWIIDINTGRPCEISESACRNSNFPSNLSNKKEANDEIKKIDSPFLSFVDFAYFKQVWSFLIHPKLSHSSIHQISFTRNQLLIQLNSEALNRCLKKLKIENVFNVLNFQYFYDSNFIDNHPNVFVFPWLQMIFTYLQENPTAGFKKPIISKNALN